MVLKINGKEVSRTGIIIKKSAEILDDVGCFLVNSFHSSIELAIKIGLLVFLFPYISKFISIFIEILKGAAGL
jgi:hypothetical protein